MCSWVADDQVQEGRKCRSAEIRSSLAGGEVTGRRQCPFAKIWSSVADDEVEERSLCLCRDLVIQSLMMR